MGEELDTDVYMKLQIPIREEERKIWLLKHINLVEELLYCIISATGTASLKVVFKIGLGQ